MCLVLLAIFTVTVGNALPAPAEHVPCLGKKSLTLQNSAASKNCNINVLVVLNYTQEMFKAFRYNI
jgi:hypothetical protein